MRGILSELGLSRGNDSGSGIGEEPAPVRTCARRGGLFSSGTVPIFGQQKWDCPLTATGTPQSDQVFFRRKDAKARRRAKKVRGDGKETDGAHREKTGNKTCAEGKRQRKHSGNKACAAGCAEGKPRGNKACAKPCAAVCALCTTGCQVTPCARQSKTAKRVNTPVSGLALATGQVASSPPASETA